MNVTMKTIILCIIFSTAALAFPGLHEDEQELQFYMDSIEDFSTDSDIDARIINGTEAEPHSIPYQVYMIITPNTAGNRSICGGSLISPNYVLTAAHCLHRANRTTVLLGAHNLTQHESSRVLRYSKNIIFHENFNITSYIDDIGLVELDEPVELDEYIDVVTLPSHKKVNTTYEGAKVRVSGWGWTEWEGKRSQTLQEVNSTIISNDRCNKAFHNIVDSEICMSGRGGVSSCKGDSGGPLIFGNTQIGIVSHGIRGCLYGYPSVFTRVTSYLDWLEEKTGLEF